MSWKLMWRRNRHRKEPLRKERRIGLKISELQNKWQPYIENAWSRCSNSTVTLIVQSPKYSNRSLVTRKTAQLQSNHPVQPEASHPVDNSDRESHPAYSSAGACDSSATFKTTSRQFSKNLVTQQTTSVLVNYSKIPLHTVQLDSVKKSATFKIFSWQIS